MVAVKLARIAAALVLALVFGRDVASALWAACVWLFEHPFVGGPAFVLLFIVGPLIAGSACQPNGQGSGRA